MRHRVLILLHNLLELLIGGQITIDNFVASLHVLKISDIPLTLTTARAIEVQHLHNLTHRVVNFGGHLRTAALLGRARPVPLGFHTTLTVETIALWALLRSRSHNELAETANEAVKGFSHE